MAQEFRTRGAWLLGAAVLAAAVAAQPASAVRTALGEPKVHPGVVLDTAGSDCTSNFVFADAANHLYIGQAAHCSSQGQDVNFDGCKEQSMPLGTQVTVVGADVSGTLAYNSWRTMQARHETNASACSDNDFALVRLPDAARSSVSPDVPYFGGPHGINTTGVEQGGMVYAYGNSPLRGGVGVLSPKRGVALSTIDDGWSYLTYFATPGIPGDSGSAVLDSGGHALGVMSSLITTPTPGANGVADIWRMFSYAHDLSGIKGLRLLDGAQPFTSGG